MIYKITKKKYKFVWRIETHPIFLCVASNQIFHNNNSLEKTTLHLKM